jgi:hypothetical protein
LYTVGPAAIVRRRTGPNTGLASFFKEARVIRVPRYELVSLVYRELKQLDCRRMPLERLNHTLQPTALVSELYLRFAGQKRFI